MLQFLCIFFDRKSLLEEPLSTAKVTSVFTVCDTICSIAHATDLQLVRMPDIFLKLIKEWGCSEARLMSGDMTQTANKYRDKTDCHNNIA